MRNPTRAFERSERGARGFRFAQFVLGVLLLSAWVDVRLPAATGLFDFLRPSPDVLVLLALFALFAPRVDWRPSRAFVALCCGALLGLRCARIADGICKRYLDRSFHLSSDLTLVPEFARLGLSTLGPLRFGLSLLALALALGLFGWLLAAVLRAFASALSQARVADLYLGAAGLLVVVAIVPLPSPIAGRRLLATPVFPRVIDELERWFTARGVYDDPDHAEQRRVFDVLWQARQARFAETPATFARLHGADVHLILVEAYGHSLLSNPAYMAELAPAYRELDLALHHAGFSVCTDFVRATVFGGNSWLTHATLETAMPISDQFEYELMLARPNVHTLARAFRAAGYRAVSVKPGTTRAAPHTRIYGFDREYAAMDLGYRGPSYAWAPMPDQFVLQTIAERELRTKRQPLFIEYALVSTHFPFSPHPPYVEDWSSLGDGSVFRRLSPIVAEPAAGRDPYVAGYLSSMRYELRVLAEFIEHQILGDAVVILLGDHQPIAPVAGLDRSRLTPMHVIARRSELLAPFVARGCAPGLLNPRADANRAMEDLAIDFMRDFSGPTGEAAR